MKQSLSLSLAPSRNVCENDRFELLCDAVCEMNSDAVFDFFAEHWSALVKESSSGFKCDAFMLAFASVNPDRHSDLQPFVRMFDVNDRTSAYLRGYVAGLTADFNNACDPQQTLNEARNARNNYQIGQLAAAEVQKSMDKVKRFSKPEIQVLHY